MIGPAEMANFFVAGPQRLGHRIRIRLPRCSHYMGCTPFGDFRKSLKRSCTVLPIRMGSLRHSSPRVSNFATSAGPI